MSVTLQSLRELRALLDPSRSGCNGPSSEPPSESNQNLPDASEAPSDRQVTMSLISAECSATGEMATAALPDCPSDVSVDIEFVLSGTGFSDT
jgi:hypothetical protein